MLTADILRHSPTVLTLAERQRFFEDGFLLVPDAVDANWLSRLRAASEELVAASGDVRVSDAQFVLEAGHSPTQPKLRRLSSPVSHHRAFWDFAATSVSADIAADVCGPDLKFYHSKLNYKWPDGGQRFDWHQDIPAWPHTDYSPVSIGVYLQDCDASQGPLKAIRGSHLDPLHSMYDAERNWVLRIPESELAPDWRARVHTLTGSAGSLVLLNCRVIHGSSANLSARMRPLLLNVYSSADSMAYVSNPIPSPYEGVIVRGAAPRWASHDPRGCELPPDWSKGYSGPWTHQATGRAASTIMKN